jgi:two-component system OmpR family response regulator
MPRILTIEDDVLIATSIERKLIARGFAVDVVRTGRQGMVKVMSGKYDLITLDRALPDFDGLSIVSTMRGVGIETPVLIISAMSEVDQRIRGLRAGCDDYLAKPFSTDEMLLRIECLLRREARQGNAMTVLRTGPLELDMIQRKARYRSQELNLMPTELRLLEFMMRHVGHVLTRRMILEAVWGPGLSLATNVIDVHVSHLRKKVDPAGEQPLIRTVRGFGYIFG